MSFFANRHSRGRPPHPDVLTPAEWRVLDEVRRGRSNAEIADQLGVSVNTVRTQISSMLSKLALADRHELAAWQGEPALAGVEHPRTFGLATFFRGSGWTTAARLGAVAAISAAAVFGLSAALSSSGRDARDLAVDPPAPTEAVSTADTGSGGATT